MLWVVYGLPVVKFQVLVVTINAAGCAIEFTYLTLYLIHAAKKIRVSYLQMNTTPIHCAIIPVILLFHVHDQSLLQRKLGRLSSFLMPPSCVPCLPSPQMKVMKLLTAVIVGFAIVVVLVLLLVHDKNKRKLIIGSLCAVFAVGMYASPLTVMVSTQALTTYFNFFPLCSSTSLPWHDLICISMLTALRSPLRGKLSFLLQCHLAFRRGWWSGPGVWNTCLSCSPSLTLSTA